MWTVIISIHPWCHETPKIQYIVRTKHSNEKFNMHKIGAYPVMRGRVSVEKRVSGGLSRSMSHMVYCPLCLGWRNMAMSRLQAPFPPHSQGLSTHGPPKAELFTQRNWPGEDRKTNRDQHKTKKLQDAPIRHKSVWVRHFNNREESLTVITNDNLVTVIYGYMYAQG